MCIRDRSHPIWAVAAPGRYGAGEMLPVSGLEDVTFLLTEPGCPYRLQFELFCRRAGIVPHVLMEADSIEGIISFARSGLGVGILPDFAAADLVESGALLRLKLEGFEPRVRSCLLYTSRCV